MVPHPAGCCSFAYLIVGRRKVLLRFKDPGQFLRQGEPRLDAPAESLGLRRVAAAGKWPAAGPPDSGALVAREHRELRHVRSISETNSARVIATANAPHTSIIAGSMTRPSAVDPNAVGYKHDMGVPSNS